MNIFNNQLALGELFNSINSVSNEVELLNEEINQKSVMLQTLEALNVTVKELKEKAQSLKAKK